MVLSSTNWKFWLEQNVMFMHAKQNKLEKLFQKKMLTENVAKILLKKPIGYPWVLKKSGRVRDFFKWEMAGFGSTRVLKLPLRRDGYMGIKIPDPTLVTSGSWLDLCGKLAHVLPAEIMQFPISSLRSCSLFNTQVNSREKANFLSLLKKFITIGSPLSSRRIWFKLTHTEILH